jgi:transcriptional regulator with XRE-family HTH domain
MFLPHTITDGRRKLGMTQETLADRAGITVRTVQRIENGQTIPRAHTIHALAEALQLPFGDFYTASAAQPEADTDVIHFLYILCLSCFSYLVLPWIHALVPAYVLKRHSTLSPEIRAFAQRIIRKQLYWTIALQGVMLLTLAFNLLQAARNPAPFFVNYLIPAGAMYVLNAIMIVQQLRAISSAPMPYSKTT